MSIIDSDKSSSRAGWQGSLYEKVYDDDKARAKEKVSPERQNEAKITRMWQTGKALQRELLPGRM